jgi:predicted outer membrane repeat protein
VRLNSVLKCCLSVGAGFVGLMVAGPTVTGAAPPASTVPCTGQSALVNAIKGANNAGGGTLNLTPGCVYSLTAPISGENGLPVIVTPISLNGNGATVNGTGQVRDLEVDAPGSLSAQNLTLTGGAATDFGGGIANLDGTVVLNHVSVTKNTAVVGGGGIASATMASGTARLTLNNSSVTNNTQSLSATDMGVGGAGILNILGTAVLNSSTVSGNTAQGFVGGGIANGDYINFSGSSSFLTLNNSAVNDNTAPNAGGGGVQNLLGTVTANGSTVNGNTSLNGGGISSGNGAGGATPPPCSSQVNLNRSQVNGNTATATPGPGVPPIAGGGIANGCAMTLNSTQVDGNRASVTSGAGIVNHGTMTLNKSQVDGNTAAGSGAIASGGGIVNADIGPLTNAPVSGILTINNSEVNDNTAGGDGGGIANGFVVGKMSLPGGSVTMNHSEVMGNTAAKGGGIFNNGGTVVLAMTTVSANHPDNCEPMGAVAGCTG